MVAAVSLNPPYQRVYEETLKSYERQKEGLEKFSILMKECSVKWKKTAALLLIPSTTQNMTPAKLSPYWENVQEKLLELEALRTKLKPLLQELVRAAKYFAGANQIYDPETSDLYLRTLGDLQGKRDQIQTIFNQMHGVKDAGLKLVKTCTALQARLSEDLDLALLETFDRIKPEDLEDLEEEFEEISESEATPSEVALAAEWDMVRWPL